MTEETDAIALPRFVRPIGVTTGWVDGPPAGPAASFGVLPPFAGLLGLGVARRADPGPALSVLTHEPATVRGRPPPGRETDDPDDPGSDPGRDADADREPRVREVLWRDDGSDAAADGPAGMDADVAPGRVLRETVVRAGRRSPAEPSSREPGGRREATTPDGPPRFVDHPGRLVHPGDVADGDPSRAGRSPAEDREGSAATPSGEPRDPVETSVVTGRGDGEAGRTGDRSTTPAAPDRDAPDADRGLPQETPEPTDAPTVTSPSRATVPDDAGTATDLSPNAAGSPPGPATMTVLDGVDAGTVTGGAVGRDGPAGVGAPVGADPDGRPAMTVTAVDPATGPEAGVPPGEGGGSPESAPAAGVRSGGGAAGTESGPETGRGGRGDAWPLPETVSLEGGGPDSRFIDSLYRELMKKMRIERERRGF